MTMSTTREFQNLSQFESPQGVRGRSRWFVQFWWLFEKVFVRSTPQVMYGWRRFAWRLFGARIGRDVLIRPGVRVTFPWKVTLGDHCWIGDDAVLYSIDDITIGEHSVVSQEAYLCTGTHDHENVSFPLITGPIKVSAECWVGARAFVGPGVDIGRGAIIGACSVVLKAVPPAVIIVGNPGRIVGRRRAAERAASDQPDDKKMRNSTRVCT